MKLKLRRQRI